MIVKMYIDLQSSSLPFLCGKGGEIGFVRNAAFSSVFQLFNVFLQKTLIIFKIKVLFC